MSDTRDAFGPLLEKLQAEMRSLRAEVRAEQVHTRELIKLRAEETELFVSGLFDRLHQRLDQTERSLDERLTRIETYR